MRKLLLSGLIVILAAACTKKDVQLVRQYLEKNKCSVVSINADKQNTNNFFMIKTFNENRILTHIKFQVNDVYGVLNRFDYAISYGQDRVIFKGITKGFNWVPETEAEFPTPPDPDAPYHLEEILEMRDTRDFEILLHHKSHYPVEVRYLQTGESVLKLEYNNRGFLSKVVSKIGLFNVTTDNRGNILTILTPPLVEEEPYYGPQQLGITNTYSDKNTSRNTNMFYETPTLFISPMYSLVELLNWGPFQPDRERIHVSLQHRYGEEYLPSPTMDAAYSNHQYDRNGNLVRYDFEGDIRQAIPYEGTIVKKDQRSITWQCSGRPVK
ncbi:MAG: hypothetical protein JNK79_02050 [Chitinophagaceae bacterium]|nr:hypothetical protein [Chitinophagaceae bacterium]